MNKSILLIAAVAMTTLFAQANDAKSAEPTVDQLIHDAKSTVSTPQKEVTPQTEEEKNGTEKKKLPEEEK